MFRSTKTYGHDVGLSACFRQWRAEGHCHFLHGYALSFSFTFAAHGLDERGWVMDFGGLKPLKEWLQQTFDHKTMIAADDPQKELFLTMERAGVCRVNILQRGVGCERFAELAGLWVSEWLAEYHPRVRCIEVECREHGANSAKWVNP